MASVKYYRKVVNQDLLDIYNLNFEVEAQKIRQAELVSPCFAESHFADSSFAESQI